MPQYLAPGVYVEEIPGPEVIQAVGTQTAGFIGPCRFGPTSGRPELLTSFLDFQRIYGDWTDLTFSGTAIPNFMALGVKGFFDEGGTSCYVCRTFNFTHPDPAQDHAFAQVPASSPSGPQLKFRARFPGTGGNMTVTLTLQVGHNSLVISPSPPSYNLTRVHQYDVVYANPQSPSAAGLYVVSQDPVGDWTFGDNPGLPLSSATFAYPLSVAVAVQFQSVDAQGLPTPGPPQAVGVFGFDSRAVGTGISTVLTANPPNRAQWLSVPVALEGTDGLDGVSIAEALFPDIAGMIEAAVAPGPPPSAQKMSVSFPLQGGSDGVAPDSGTYEGDQFGFQDYQEDPVQRQLNGLFAFEAVDDISIVAAPGASTGWNIDSDGTVTSAGQQIGLTINEAVIAHCETMLYRVASIDTPPKFLPTQALDYRNNRSSNYAALYYPWITISSPIDGTPLNVPPAAYMAGIWARSDNNYGVIKAPANEVVRSALDFESRINKAQQELLNPEGVNCLRFFPGPGFLVWGARTISDDPEWKYLSMRRYFCYLEKSIDEGTQWVVFEVNGPALWDRVRHAIEGFLLDEWKSGALLGSKPAEAYFVKCDASTMTQDDLDNGRLVCLIGVAAAKPAEFVIFRIGQITASANS